jgi:hypothetical protein
MIAINKLVLLILFLIILVVCIFLLFGVGTPIGEEMDLQNQLRMCCTAFRASECKDISVICNEVTMESIGSIAQKLSMDIDLVKDFCNCP